MVCKKCGSEIKEGDIFCTNCGTSIDDKVAKQQNNKIIIKYILIIAIMLIVIFGTVALIKFNKERSDNKELSNNSVNTIEESKQTEIKYITNDSDVSPTGKEFIGTFSDNLKNIYESTMNKEKIVTYDTSINNMKQYSIEAWIDNLLTGKKDKAIEEVYYYNSLNSKLIGYKFRTTQISQLIKSLLSSKNMSIDEFEQLKTDSTINVFQNLHNDKGEQRKKEATEYIDYWKKKIEENGVEEENVVLSGETYRYQIIGDVLKIVKLFNDNGLELLYLPYDLNSKPEEIIQRWYSTVNVLDETIKEINTDNNLYVKKEIEEDPESEKESESFDNLDN